MLEIGVGNLTDIGKRRKCNEDSYGFFRLGADEVLAVVADGVGGHASGEIASRMAVEMIQKVYAEERGEKDILDGLKSAFEAANFTILQKSFEQEELNGMGTTATALVLKGDQAFVGHMGDSRAYLFRDSTPLQLTKDHSIVNRLVEQGLLSRKEANRHPQRNVIYKTLGLNMDSDLQLLGPIPVSANDILLLCSDGLTNLVADQEILEVVKRESPQHACENLIQLANQRGGHDNITVQILKVARPKYYSISLLERRKILFIFVSILAILLFLNGLFLIGPDALDKIGTEVKEIWRKIPFIPSIKN
jgi:PPM family protein phosphatase